MMRRGKTTELGVNELQMTPLLTVHTTSAADDDDAALTRT